MSYPILWHSNAPHVPTGYGLQTALFTTRLVRKGFDVAISALWGLNGSPTRWNGITVLPNGCAPGAIDVINGHAAVHFGARKDGLVLVLADCWTLDPPTFKMLKNLAIWIPIDCAPLSAADRAVLEVVKPKLIAMSKHGQKMLHQAGYESQYVPHGIDTTVFRGDRDRAKARDILEIPADAFVVGLNAANKGVPSRKAFGNQFLAFARFAKKHADAILMVHSNVTQYDGERLDHLADACGIKPERIRYSNQYMYAAGLFSNEYVADFYAASDVVTNASMGEGFGLATIEAQACGTPVVVANASASKELCGSGWKVDGIEFWVDRHQAFWLLPSTGELIHAYESAYDKAAKMRQSAAGFAKRYDADKILDEYMVPALEKIGGDS